MGHVVNNGSYIHCGAETWEEYDSFHAYMKMYAKLSREESIAYAKRHLGPYPAKVVVNRIEIVPDSDDVEEQDF